MALSPEQKAERDALRVECDEKGIEYSKQLGIPGLKKKLAAHAAMSSDAPPADPEPSDEGKDAGDPPGAHAPEAPKPEAPEESDEEEAQSFSVFDKFGRHVRDYTLEIHGDKALACAKSFSGKIGGTYKPLA